MTILTYYLNDLDNITCEIIDNGERMYVVDQDKIEYGFNYISNMKFSNIYNCELGNYVTFNDRALSLKIENYSEVLGRIDKQIALEIHKKVEDFEKRKKLPAIIKYAMAGTLTLVLTGFTAYATTDISEEPIPEATTLMDTSIFDSTVDTTSYIYEVPYIPSTISDNTIINEIVPDEIEVEGLPAIVDYPEVKVTADNRVYFTGVRQTGISRNYTNYTYFYDRWMNGTNQRALADIWDAYGRTGDRGIATINGRYLVAVSTTFGGVGDYIDIVLTNGEVIPCIIADAKSADDRNYTPYGHRLGGGCIDGVEWESTGAKSDIDISGWAGVPIDYIQMSGITILNQPIEMLDEEILEFVDDENIEILLDQELIDEVEIQDETEANFIEETTELEDTYDEAALENIYEDEDVKVYSL